MTAARLFLVVFLAFSATRGEATVLEARIPRVNFPQLKTGSFLVLPAGTFMSRRMETIFNDAWRRCLSPRNGKDITAWLYWREDPKAAGVWETRSKKIKTFVGKLTRQLEAALPGENFHLGSVTVQVSEGKVPRATRPHIDGNRPYHFVVTYPLQKRGRGTIIYKTDAAVKRLETIPASPGSAAVMSGVGREIGRKYRAPSTPLRRNGSSGASFS